MTRRLHINLIYGLMCIMTCCLLLSGQARASDETLCTLDDDEYAVIAEVLSRTGQDVVVSGEKEKPGRKPLPERHIDLAGIPSSFFLLYEMTLQGTLDAKAENVNMATDYNRRNAQSCKIDNEKLHAFAPKGKRVNLVSREEQQKIFGTRGRGGDESSRRRPGPSGITYISRPGFNAKRTEAVMQINHVADPEMGVGYRVYLEKSPKNGAWILVGSVLNRRY
jgi:hypothetical protein